MAVVSVAVVGFRCGVRWPRTSHRRERSGAQSVVGDLPPPPLPPGRGVERRLWPGDVPDAGVTEFDQMAGRQPGTLFLVDRGDLHTKGWCCAGSDQDGGYGAGEGSGPVAVGGFGCQHDDAVNSLVVEVLE